MTHRLYYLCIIFVLTLGFTPAHADETQDPNIARLTTVFEDIIAQQQNNSTPERQITFDGHVVVEPSESYYAITLPYIKIQHTNGQRTEVGIISINAAQGKKEGEWTIAFAIPTSIITYDKDDQQISRTTINEQRTIGVWQESVHNFTKLDANFSDITIESATPLQSTSISSAQIRYNFEQDKNGLWSGPAIFTMKDLKLDSPEKSTKAEVREIKATVKLDKYNDEYRKEHIKTPQSINTAELPGLFLNGFISTGNGFSTQYSVTGLHYTKKSSNPEKPDTIVTLEQAYFDFVLEDFLTNSGKLKTHMNVKEIYFSPKPEEYENIAPSNFKLDLTMHNIPFTEITKLGKTTIEKTAKQPEMAKFAGLSALMSMPVLLTQANTYIEIKDNFFSGKIYKVNFDGNIKTDATAAKSATAEIKSSFYGLDKVLAQTQMLSNDPNGKYADEFKKLNGVLEKIKRFAKVTMTDDNTFIHFIDMVLNKEGKLLLNGKDLMTAQEGKVQGAATAQ